MLSRIFLVILEIVTAGWYIGASNDVIEGYPFEVSLSVSPPDDIDIKNHYIAAFASNSAYDLKKTIPLKFAALKNYESDNDGIYKVDLSFFDLFQDLQFHVLTSEELKVGKNYDPGSMKHVFAGPIIQRAYDIYPPSQVHLGVFEPDCKPVQQPSEIDLNVGVAPLEGNDCKEYRVLIQFATQPTPGVVAHVKKSAPADSIDQFWDVEFTMRGNKYYNSPIVRTAAWPVPSVYSEDICGEPMKTKGFAETGQFWLARLGGIPEDEIMEYRIVPRQGDWLSAKKAPNLETEWISFRPPTSSVHSAVIANDVGTDSHDGLTPNFLPGVDGVLSLIHTWVNQVDNSSNAENRIDSWNLIGNLSYSFGRLSRQLHFFDENSYILSRIPLAAAMGNRERAWPGSDGLYPGKDSYGECGVATQRYFQNLPWLPTLQPNDRPWYSYQAGPVKYYILSSDNPMTNQVRWLTRELAAEVKFKRKPHWRVLAFHRPAVSSAKEEGLPASAAQSSSRYLRTVLSPYMREMDLVIQGHEHTYVRSCLIDGVRSDPNNPEVGPKEWASPEEDEEYDDHVKCKSKGSEFLNFQFSDDYVSVLVGTGGARLSHSERPTTPSWVEKVEENRHGAARLFATKEKLRVEFWGTEPRELLDEFEMVRELKIKTKDGHTIYSDGLLSNIVNV